MEDRKNSFMINDSKISSFMDSVLRVVKKSGYSSEEFSRELTEIFSDAGMIRTWYRDEERTGGWKLRNGIWSPYYIDLRPMCAHEGSNNLLAMIGTSLALLIEEEAPYVTKVMGIGEAGIPISTAITAFGGIPSGWSRKLEDIRRLSDFTEKIGKYGQHNVVEGIIKFTMRDGDRIAAVDDVITGATSKKIALRQLEHQLEKLYKTLGRRLDVKCEDVVVCIDREQGGKDALEEIGINLYSQIQFSNCIEWLKDKWYPIEYSIIKEYHEDPEPYQKESLRKQLEQQAITESPYLKHLS
jgi:orotate phosphoribosyltransferase